MDAILGNAPVNGTKYDWAIYLVCTLLSMFLGHTAWGSWLTARKQTFKDYATLAYQGVESLKNASDLPAGLAVLRDDGALDKTSTGLELLKRLLAADGRTLKPTDAERAKVMFEALHGMDATRIKALVAGATQVIHNTPALRRIEVGGLALEQSIEGAQVQSTEDIIKQVLASLPPTPTQADLVDAVTAEVIKRMTLGLTSKPDVTAEPIGGTARAP